jgi:hypothetical protein
MKYIVAAILALYIPVSMAGRSPSKPPNQRNIKSAPMAKQQGEPADSGAAPQSYNESASAYRGK